MIELRDVYKIYHIGDHEVHALNGISFSIGKGELVAIMGASGSGKSTAMNIIGVLDHPTSGEYYLNGEKVLALSGDILAGLRNRTIGFVFQQFFLLPRLTALQNVSLPLTYRGLNPKEIKERALASLEKVGMADFINHRPNELSGGQQQRVAIARALVTAPAVILADEPTGALDSKTGQSVMDLLIELNQKDHATIIIVTHDLSVAQQCQRIIKLKDGAIVA